MNEYFSNPFRPGAGHMPPYLAGRNDEKEEFRHLISQKIILDNMVLTGLRGVGKTVLLDTFKPLAIQNNWFWVGTDLSESASVSEENLALRLITDISVLTSNIVIKNDDVLKIGFKSKANTVETKLTYKNLLTLYENTPGLVIDKLKYILEFVWQFIKEFDINGVVFAYDEAQNLSDQTSKEQYPLGILLDVFQSLQKKEIPFMLVLTGLPTLFPKLVDSRTFSERMFRVVTLKQLKKSDSKEAVQKPINDTNCPVKLTKSSVDIIVKESAGYPYFIQFICREVYDLFLSQIKTGKKPKVPIDEITRKLDTDFFAGRWARATDRQRELLLIISKLPNACEEFSVQEIANLSKKELKKPFSNSHVNQMLSSLATAGLIYKNRHGKYAFAVPLLGQFIIRQV
ncbi:MAG: ATP-binding protein [Candidatus Marinimicrobia bacterium]|nr:ATP-binding protein [Candidatus Neomarinimicrobiota bacterium]